MNAIIIYDSKFGNTERIAKAIGHALEHEFDLSVHSVDEQPTLPVGLELLVIGGPTHAHGLSQPMRTFLQDISAGELRDVMVLAFDTRFRMPKFISGTAAAKIAGALRRKGAKLIMPPESFFVSRTEGHPLEVGEEARAIAWAHDVIALLAPAA